MLSAGSAPDFNTRGDYTQPGVLSTLDDCVALVTDEGDELLLFAPFGSEVTAQSPRIQIGDEEYDLGDEVELIGQAQDVFMPIGNAKPAAWEECVGDYADHTVMFVVGTS